MLHSITEYIVIHGTHVKKLPFWWFLDISVFYHLEFKSNLFTTIISQDKAGDLKADTDVNFFKSLQMLFK